MWVARAELADLIRENRHPEQSDREIARRAEVDPKTLRNILQGKGSPWVPLKTADAILGGMDCSYLSSQLTVVISA